MLVRPEMSPRLETGVELTLEQRILGELSDIKDGQNFMRVVLLGGTYRDVPHEGKLPMQDQRMDLLNKHQEVTDTRIGMLETDKIGRDATLRAAKVFSGWIGAIVGSVAGACSAALLHVLLHH